MTLTDRAWLALAVLTVHVFERNERITYCTHCEAWHRVVTRSLRRTR